MSLGTPACGLSEPSRLQVVCFPPSVPMMAREKEKPMIKQSDVFILLAVAISFVLSGYLWFSGQHEEGLFTAVWVPSILCFGIYFKLMAQRGPR